MSLHEHLGDDGELVATATEGEEEFRLGGAVGVSDCSVGEDDFEVVDVVASKALLEVSDCDE
jgi:hypothetical protein